MIIGKEGKRARGPDRVNIMNELKRNDRPMQVVVVNTYYIPADLSYYLPLPTLPRYSFHPIPIFVIVT